MKKLALALLLIASPAVAEDYRITIPAKQVPTSRLTIEHIDRGTIEPRVALYNDLLDLARRISPKCERDMRFYVEQQLFPTPGPKLIVNPYYKAKK